MLREGTARRVVVVPAAQAAVPRHRGPRVLVVGLGVHLVGARDDDAAAWVWLFPVGLVLNILLSHRLFVGTSVAQAVGHAVLGTVAVYGIILATVAGFATAWAMEGGSLAQVAVAGLALPLILAALRKLALGPVASFEADAIETDRLEFIGSAG